MIHTFVDHSFSAVPVRALALSCLMAIAITAGSASNATADIVGFAQGSYSYQQRDSGSAVTATPTSIHITTGLQQVRDIWFFQQQTITAFTASFTYQATTDSGGGVPQGIAFIVQNSSAGTGALGTGFNQTGFGFDGITPSIAVTIENNSGPGTTRSGFYRNGVISGSGQPTAPVNAFSHDPISVTIQYTGAFLNVGMTDTVTGMSAPPQSYIVSPTVSAALASSSAFIGFGASTAQGGSNQIISDFSYVVPTPSAFAVVGMLTVVGLRRRR